MKITSVLLFVLVLTSSGVAKAAFPTCEDARNYGWNRAVLITSLVYQRVQCDTELLDSAEKMLAIIGSNPIVTSDPDETKVCYFEGYYSGLIERLRFEYQKCYFEVEDRTFFECISADTHANYAANILLGLYKSVEEPKQVDVETVFAQELKYDICFDDNIENTCSETIFNVFAEAPEFEDQLMLDWMVEEFCYPNDDEDI
jgi:hypothetical protein